MERGPRPIKKEKDTRPFKSWDEVQKSEGDMGAVVKERINGTLKPREAETDLNRLAIPKQRKVPNGVRSAEEIIRRMPERRKPKHTSIVPKTELS